MKIKHLPTKYISLLVPNQARNKLILKKKLSGHDNIARKKGKCSLPLGQEEPEISVIALGEIDGTD